jgi:hypothetical protein
VGDVGWDGKINDGGAVQPVSNAFDPSDAPGARASMAIIVVARLDCFKP